MALGAESGSVLRLVIAQGMKMTLIGAGIGVVSALGLARLIESRLYNVTATDPLIWIAVLLLLVFVAMLACYIPARRASKVDPMVALRCE
jgi:putative ABC transport system permease protein